MMKIQQPRFWMPLLLKLLTVTNILTNHHRVEPSPQLLDRTQIWQVSVVVKENP